MQKYPTTGLIGSRLGYPGIFLSSSAVALLAAGVALRLRAPSLTDAPPACGAGSELLQIEVPTHLGESP